jgi:hypothetical protein
MAETVVEVTRKHLRRIEFLVCGIKECFVCGAALAGDEGTPIGNEKFVCHPSRKDCRERAVHEGNGVVS